MSPAGCCGAGPRRLALHRCRVGLAGQRQPPQGPWARHRQRPVRQRRRRWERWVPAPPLQRLPRHPRAAARWRRPADDRLCWSCRRRWLLQLCRQRVSSGGASAAPGTALRPCVLAAGGCIVQPRCPPPACTPLPCPTLQAPEPPPCLPRPRLAAHQPGQPARRGLPSGGASAEHAVHFATVAGPACGSLRFHHLWKHAVPAWCPPPAQRTAIRFDPAVVTFSDVEYSVPLPPVRFDVVCAFLHAWQAARICGAYVLIYTPGRRCPLSPLRRTPTPSAPTCRRRGPTPASCACSRASMAPSARASSPRSWAPRGPARR